MAAAEQEVAALQSGHGTARGEVNRLQGRTEIEHRRSGWFCIARAQCVDVCAPKLQNAWP